MERQSWERREVTDERLTQSSSEQCSELQGVAMTAVSVLYSLWHCACSHCCQCGTL